MKQKRQREEGRFEAMQYFDKIEEVKLTWSRIIFDDGKVDWYSENGKIVNYSQNHDVRVKLGDIL
jgi:hypothetical protein